jgi:hypothetical protein
MKLRTLSIAVTALMAAGMLLLVGCSSDSGGSSNTETISENIIDEFVETTYAVAKAEPAEAEFASLTEGSQETIFEDSDIQIYDMVLKDKVIYTATQDGIITYNTIDGATSLISAESPIKAAVDIGESIIFGGDNLYTLKDGLLSEEDFQLNLSGTITALYNEFPNLYVGTTEAFYSIDVTGIRELATNVRVSAITSDGLGIWVGTAGDGLYRWNGNSFKKRYLKRDSTLFDNVTALDYKHNHLYLGTDNGLFVHDGGAWTPFGLADGLPSETITAINASEWVVKVGTARGPVTFFNNEFKLISKLEGMIVTQFLKDDNKMLAATSNAGLVMKSGGLVTTLFDSSTQPRQMALEEEW